MAWGLGVGMIMVAFFFVFFAIIIFKEMRTHRFWRQKVEEGDIEMITQLIQAEVEHWRKERPEKGVPTGVWQGIQSVEIVQIGADYIHASSVAEPQFAMVNGARQQVSSALTPAKQIASKIAERLFYDVSHVRPDRVQIDIYMTFHEVGGDVAQRCILSLQAKRSAIIDIDWDADSPEAIVATLGARYKEDRNGTPVPFEPDVETIRAGSESQTVST